VYLYVDDHGETLAGGLRVNPGDEVPASQVNVTPEDDKGADHKPDQWLIDEGKLVALTPHKLTGKALHARAAELDIDGRADMSADELRDAIAAAEAQGETTDDPQEA
jgi:hypothetical protein